MRCVDWNNSKGEPAIICATVTPRMRCVDWNPAPRVSHAESFSHTSYEVCGLKYCKLLWEIKRSSGHTSYEVCGLKSLMTLYSPTESCTVTPRMRCVDWNCWDKQIVGWWVKSHLVWGVWIEMQYDLVKGAIEDCHTSYEVCGLKYNRRYNLVRLLKSHLVWGVWIEIG